MKKKISLATIILVSLSALTVILALFGAIKIKGLIADLLFTFLTLTVSGVLIINCTEMLERKNKMAIGSLSLICLSTVLVVLCYWTKLDNFDFYIKLTLVTSVLSVCFNLISSNILKVGKKYILFQSFTYICYSIVSTYLILAFLSIISLEKNNLKIFILFIILSFVLMCILSIISKKQFKESSNIEYIKITKSEYLELLSIKKQFEITKKETDHND